MYLFSPSPGPSTRSKNEQAENTSTTMRISVVIQIQYRCLVRRWELCEDRTEKHICSNIGVELKCPQHRRWPSVIFRINADTRQHQSFVDTLSQSGPITNIVSQWQHHNIQLHTTLEHSVAKGYCSIYLGPHKEGAL